MQNKVSYLYINEIQPSQLYLNRAKLYAVEKELRRSSLKCIEPVPVKKIGENIFFTDGHTRAYALYKSGEKRIPVYLDEDELDWVAYYICVDWCRKKGIHNISHLSGRILESVSYEKEWHSLCREMHKSLEEGVSRYISIKTETEPEIKSSICREVLGGLKEWFGIEKAVKDYIYGVGRTIFYTVSIGDSDLPVGFISLAEHNSYCSEIYVMGVFKEFHNRGIGSLLIDHVSGILNKKGKLFLTVKTLSDSHPDENYKKTREFYIKKGFYPIEEFKTLWGSENPCLFMLKVLN